jgi:large subunit ribosomal protein L24
VIDKMLSNDFVIVSGANMRKKCIKADPQNNIEAEIRSIEGKIHVSNIALYDVKASTKIKVGFKINEDGTKIRVNKETGDSV